MGLPLQSMEFEYAPRPLWKLGHCLGNQGQVLTTDCDGFRQAGMSRHMETVIFALEKVHFQRCAPLVIDSEIAYHLVQVGQGLLDIKYRRRLI